MIDDLVSQIETRFTELQQELSDPDVIADRERFTSASRAYRDLEPAARLASEYRRAVDDFEGARELLAENGDDPELRSLLESSREQISSLEDEPVLGGAEGTDAGSDLINGRDVDFETDGCVLAVGTVNRQARGGMLC